MNNTLNVAVATDTILYAPFYLALYGGDFNDTPFGKLDINIIGQKNDMVFKPNDLPSKAVDGFVTLSLLFGYADIGICDPSYIIDLYNADNNNFKSKFDSAFNIFASSLKDEAKISFCETYSQHFKLDKGNIEVTNYTNLQESIKNNISIKVIGGLISKIAFSVVGSSTTSIKKNFKFGDTFFKKDADSLKDNILKQLFCTGEPSTCYHIGKSINNYHNSRDFIFDDTIQFGEELSKIQKVQDSVVLSCDFVTIDHLEKQQKVIIYDDYVSLNEDVMFTGIIANTDKTDKIKNYQAFLYGIEKNLFHIDNIIEHKTSYDLSIYFKSKLLKLKSSKFFENELEIISFLISDLETEKEFKYKKNEDGSFTDEHLDKDKLIENVNKLISAYTERLFKWKRDYGNKLYYKTIKANKKDLINIYKIREITDEQNRNKEKHNTEKELNINKYCNFNLLDNWFKDEKTIQQKNNCFIWKLLTDNRYLLYFTALFIAIESSSLFLKIFGLHIFEINDTFWKVILLIIFSLFIVSLYNLVVLSHKFLQLLNFKDYVFIPYPTSCTWFEKLIYQVYNWYKKNSKTIIIIAISISLILLVFFYWDLINTYLKKVD